MEEKKILVTKYLEGNEPTQLKGVQLLMEPYVQEIMIFGGIIFGGTTFFLLYKLFQTGLGER